MKDTTDNTKPSKSFDFCTKAEQILLRYTLLLLLVLSLMRMILGELHQFSRELRRVDSNSHAGDYRSGNEADGSKGRDRNAPAIVLD